MNSNTIATDELLELVADMLAARWRKGQIKQAIRNVNGGPCARGTYESIINGARGILNARLGVDTSEQKANSVGFYESIIRDEELAPETRLKAQKQLENLVGLGSQFELVNESAQESAAKARAAARAMREATHASDPAADETRPSTEG